MASRSWKANPIVGSTKNCHKTEYYRALRYNIEQLVNIGQLIEYIKLVDNDLWYRITRSAQFINSNALVKISNIINIDKLVKLNSIRVRKRKVVEVKKKYRINYEDQAIPWNTEGPVMILSSTNIKKWIFYIMIT